jgi:hypothetical protein
VDTRILSVLERYGARRKKLSRKRFGEAAAIYRDMSSGILPEAEARIRVKRVMEANGFRAKRGGWTMSRRWYRRVDKAERNVRERCKQRPDLSELRPTTAQLRLCMTALDATRTLL